MKGKAVKKFKKLLPLAIMFVFGGALGTGMMFLADKSPLGAGPTMLILLCGLYIGFIIHVVIHEAGHLVGGLLSGYRFCSFRAGSFIIMKAHGRLTLKRFSLAGTGGQCLMAPPEMVDGKIPVLMYNLSGAAANLLISGAMLAAALIWPWTAAFFALVPMAAVGCVLGLTNGIPLHTALMDNDGYNAISLTKDPAALRAFWVQLKLSELSNEGQRLCDMPEEYFALPEDRELGNSMCAALAVFSCGRLMSEAAAESDESAQEAKLIGADRLMAKYLLRKTAIANLHKAMLKSDRIFCALILGRNRADSLYTKEQRKLMKALKNDPATMRTEYALALLHDKDTERAMYIKEKFEKMAKNYPYAGEIATERGLMALAERKAAEE